MPKSPAAVTLQRQLQQAVLTAVASFAKPKVLLAFSGGLDSLVLLHLLASLRGVGGFQLKAAHVHHGLQAQAQSWAEFCQHTAAALQVDYQCCRVQLAEPGRNIEQQARTLRYEALAELSDPDTLLMTAHHADDQLETILLALKRGSGLAGLSGIAAHKPFAGTTLVRPLLAFSRADLECYARQHQLAYVADPSNQDDSFDRNFLRLHVLPVLQQRFPAMCQTAARSAQLLQQSLHFQQQQLNELLPSVLRDNQLDLCLLKQKQNPARDLLFRAYLARFDIIPTAEQIQVFDQTFFASAADAQPLLQWGGWQLRRFDDLLYLLDVTEQRQLNATSSSGCELVPEQQQHWMDWQFVWSCSAEPPADHWQSLPLSVAAEGWLQVGSGHLNQRFTPAGSLHSKALKDWCKQWKVPPWRRGSMPFIIAGQQKQVIAVPDYASHCNAAQANSWLHFTKQVST